MQSSDCPRGGTPPVGSVEVRLRQGFSHSIEHHAPTSNRGQAGIGLEFGQNVIMAVETVETHDYAFTPLGEPMDLLHDLRIGARTLEHVDPAGHRILLDGLAIVWANLNVHANDPCIGRSTVQRVQLEEVRSRGSTTLHARFPSR